MPAKTPAQKRLMDAAAHNPAFAKKVGVPVKVAKEFSKASKGETFKKGGDMATTKMGKPVMKAGMSIAKVGMKKPTPMADTAMARSMGMKKGGMPMVMKDGKKVPAFAAKKMMGGGMAYFKGGSASSRADGIASKGKTKGKLLNKGGMAKKYC